ncbi:hypothetical protein [Yoonia sp. BS5-3]|uniref:DUF7282 domain-containing protein n=1 Tax=Yoonia phaeophyticola TaxID=3137369 RepID=A0ABZ2V2K5_9RHOB
MNTLMKTTAIIAALGLGTVAAAEATFGLQNTVDDDGLITIELVTTPQDGILAIYDYSTGEFGELLGTADLHAGANTDVKVSLDPSGAVDIAAVVYEGDLQEPTMASAWIELDVNDS